jgi:hypothetical protein
MGSLADYGHTDIGTNASDAILVLQRYITSAYLKLPGNQRRGE